MAHTASARKRNRQNKAKNLQNRAVKHAIKTHIRRVVAAIDAKDVALANRELQTASKRIDKAAARRIVHRNTAARTKSRLATRIAALQSTQAATDARD